MRSGRRERAGMVLAGLAVLCLSASAWANVYPAAVRVDATGFDQACGTAKVSYILNEDADGTDTLPGVKIEVLNAEDVVVRTVIIPRQKKGKHTFVWDGRDDDGNAVPNGDYRVRITAADFGYTSWTKISSDSDIKMQYYSPRGVAVNKNPWSPYYGRVYVAEGLAGTVTAGVSPSRTTTVGLYVLDADGTDPIGQGDTAVNASGFTGGGVSPFKPTVGEDDNVYVADYSDGHSGVFRIDANLNPASAVEVLDSTGRAANGVNGTHGSVSSVIVEGSGPTLSIVTTDEDFETPADNVGGLMLRYFLGTNPLPKVGITNREADFKAEVVNSLVDAVRGSDGRYYWTQYRLTSVASYREFVIFTASPAPNATDQPGDEIIHYTTHGAYGYVGVDIDEARDRVALTTRGSNSAFVIRRISNPDTIEAVVSTGGSQNRDISFDAAGNVYNVNLTTERLTIWSPPDGPNSMSTISSIITVNKAVNGPIITDQPSDFATLPGGTATFTVGATGSGLTYRWMRDGVELTDGGKYSGTDSPTLTVTGVTREDDHDATFAVKVCSNNGVQVSNTVILSVGVVLIQQPAPSTTICASGNASISVVAQGLGTLSYQWQKLVGGVWGDITNTATISGVTSSTLVFTGTLPEDAGQYRCRVTDSADPGQPVYSNTAVITVSTGPIQTAISGDKGTGTADNPLIPIGGAASFQCTMVGTGDLMYRWYWRKDGVETPITEGIGRDYIVFSNIPCTANGADIICRVTDDCGTRENDYAGRKPRVYVVIPPEVCDNGVDDDCDGYVDCEDEDCRSAGLCCNTPVADAHGPQGVGIGMGDGDVDADDFAIWQLCYTGNVLNAPPVGIEYCTCLDYTNDGLVNEDDLAAFIACGSGPGIPADPTCDDRPSGLGKVVINELVYDLIDGTGTNPADHREFVELYNRSNETVDISGWIVRASDDDTNRVFTIPGGIGSGTTLLAPGGFYVITSPNVNVDAPNPPFLHVQVLSGAGATDVFENGPDAVELLDGNRKAVDVVVYGRNKAGTVNAQSEGAIWGDLASVDTTIPLSVSRWLDGLDTDSNGRDFGMRPWTPGSSNHAGVPIITSFTLPNVDSAAVGSSVAGLIPSFQPAIVIDPQNASTTVSGFVVNPNPIPPSPQGGRAAVLWDFPAGGGNMAISEGLMNNVGALDLYVYLDTSFDAWGEATGSEATVYGIMGTIDPLCATPDPEALVIGDTVNISGITGLAWIFTKAKSATGTVCKLYMVNAGPGGDSSPPNSPWAVHATIDMAAQPSGWYRLRINYNNGTVTASGAGQTVNFSTTPDLVGSAYVGYRESVTGIPSFLRPATFDTAP